MTRNDSDADQRFSALAHPRRRSALSCLNRHHVLTLADLADELAVEEHGMTIDGIPADAVAEIYLRLYHCHVPKLVEANLVEYDQDRDLVAITDAGTAAYTWLQDSIYEFSDPQPQPCRTCVDDE